MELKHWYEGRTFAPAEANGRKGNDRKMLGTECSYWVIACFFSIIVPYSLRVRHAGVKGLENRKDLKTDIRNIRKQQQANKRHL